ncbi:hypothetical protein PI124_g23202 [Phytophthora idaei]|nr:hypothetical protein PI124_g23202 [Phytophthora idaei]
MVQRPSNNAGLSGYAQVSASTGLTSSGGAVNGMVSEGSGSSPQSGGVQCSSLPAGLGAVQGTLNPRARTPLTAIMTYGGCRATTTRLQNQLKDLQLTGEPTEDLENTATIGEAHTPLQNGSAPDHPGYDVPSNIKNASSPNGYGQCPNGDNGLRQNGSGNQQRGCFFFVR